MNPSRPASPQSVKFNREKAERLFSNALKKGDHRIHLGTAFHLAELAGVRLEPPSRPRDTHANNASNASNAAPFSHTRARDNNVEIEIEEQVDPFTHLPFFPEGHEWPRMLRQIMAFGQSREQRDDEPFSSCLAAIVGDGKRQAYVFTISGGDIYTRRTNRFY